MLYSSKSPFHAYSEAKGILAFYIDSANVVTDTISAGACFNASEGGSIQLVYSNGTPLKFNPDIIYFDFNSENKNDSSLTLYMGSDFKKVTFKKILNRTTSYEANFGVDYAAKKAIFSGDYYCLDSLKNQIFDNISFNADGTIIGFGNHKLFSVWTNYSEMIDTLNYMTLYSSSSSKEKVNFNFNVHKDTIRLYNISNLQGDSTQHEHEFTSYFLIKK